ncbi:MAG: peptidoglycan DD-metalloendopeptidase family protein [Oscillospiraceae bacterium]|nr:peptidoglycan DD-metalloendopeptidase family protein [Oscillospiraceae bacterium]
MYCRQVKHRIVALVVVAIVFMMLFAAFPVINVGAATLEEMQAESERLRNEAKEIESIIRSQEKDLTDQQAYKNTLDKKIKNTTAQIDLLIERIDAINARIKSINKNIEQKEQEIAQKELEIDEQFEALRIRLRAISKTGNLSVLQMLMDTESYTDYLIKSKMMERVAQNDKKLMDELEREIEKIDAEKEKLYTDKAEVEKMLAETEKLKKQSDAQKAELDVLHAKANAALKKIQSTKSVYEQKLRQTKKEQQALENQIRRIIDQNSGDGRYGNVMFWPVPTVRNISSFYGPRWGGFHKGIDIANGSIPIYGENIVAAASGTVIYANYTNSWGGGYGYYIIIDHGLDGQGRRISTLYAHCSKVYARVGQKVVGGETVIALAGNTGNVTGPHLHFEVRENGTPVDPIGKGYIKFNR